MNVLLQIYDFGDEDKLKLSPKAKQLKLKNLRIHFSLKSNKTYSNFLAS